jgi:membrane-bound lytic murein transglycosylase B
VRRLAVLATVAVALATSSPASAHSARDAQAARAAAADAPLPRTAEELAALYADTTTELYAAVDDWLATGNPATGEAPDAVQRLAITQQRIGRLLGRDRAKAEHTIRLVEPAATRRFLAQDIAARRDLISIRSVVVQKPKIRIGKPQPAAKLRAHYRRAYRRFGVGFPLLAAVNYIESAFGKVRNESVSGARGPMQFMPATWKAYGLGGDVNDPADAILGAANYLHANGAPQNEQRALFHYNPSRAYVSAIQRYTRLIGADERTFYVLYARAVYIGGKRRSGPR